MPIMHGWEDDQPKPPESLAEALARRDRECEGFPVSPLPSKRPTMSTVVLPRYRCHKEVEAFKIAGIVYSDHGATLDNEDGSLSVEVDNKYLHKHNPTVGGYFVRYKDGYKSFSPADAFEDGYTLLDNISSWTTTP